MEFVTDACPPDDPDAFIRNGDFSEGSAHWTIVGDFHADSGSGGQRSSPGYAYLSESTGDWANDLSGDLFQDLTIPADAEAAILTFWLSIGTTEPLGADPVDVLSANIFDQSGQFLLGLNSFSNRNASTGYTLKAFDLSSLAGESVRLLFRGTTNATNPTVFRIDDVNLEVEFAPPGGDEGDGKPSVTTGKVESIGSNTATLTGSVLPNGSATTAWFDWGDTTEMRNRRGTDSVGSGTAWVEHSTTISTFACNRTYFFRIGAENEHGTAFGPTQSFTTGACPELVPMVETTGSSSVSTSHASLNAFVEYYGLPTEGWFEYGKTAGFGSESLRVPFPEEHVHASMGSELNFLDCGTTYFFRAVAENQHGRGLGNTLFFTTTACENPGGNDEPPKAPMVWIERQSCHGDDPAVLIQWSESQGADSSYMIERRDGGYVAVVDTELDGYRHLVTGGLEFDTAYEFRVTAFNSIGSSASQFVPVHVIDRTCLAGGSAAQTPGSFIATERVFCTGEQPSVELRWSDSTGAETYSIQRSSEAPGQGTTFSGINETRFVDSSIGSPGFAYAYRVTAHNTHGSTEAQDVILLVPLPCTEEGLPGEFFLTSGPAACIDDEPAIPITWTDSSGADELYRYKLFQGQSGNSAGRADVENGYGRYLTTGVSRGRVNRAVMIAPSISDDTKRRVSNYVYNEVPVHICQPPTLAPSASTREAVGVTETGAILRGSVRANGSSTTAHFEWGTSTLYGNETTPVAVGDGTIFVRPSAQLSNLGCGLQYHFRLVVANGHGITFGSDAQFATADCVDTGPPMVATEPASNLAAHSATLSLSVNPRGLATEVWYQYGRDTSLNKQTTRFSVGSSSGSVKHDTWISGLQCDANYSYRVAAENEMGQTFGDILSFATAACPSTNIPPTIQLSSPEPMAHSPTEWFLSWSASDPDDDATIHLYRSLTASCASPILISPTFIDGETNSYIWETAGLPNGSYYLLAVIDDGQDQASSCTTAPVVIESGPTLIFSDSFESRTLGNWSSVHPSTGEGFSITPAAAFIGHLGLEIQVEPCSATDALTIADRTILGTETFVACQKVDAFEVDLETGSDVTIVSGSRVSFGSGFSVRSGAKLRVSVEGEGGPRYLQDASPAYSATYAAEFGIDTSGLTLSSGAEVDLLVGYNQFGQPLFRITSWYDETVSRLKAAGFVLPSLSNDTWLNTGPIGMDPGPRGMRIDWRAATSAESGSVRFCVLDLSRTGSCASQYFPLQDKVAFIRWGIVNRSGPTAGVLKLDHFQSMRY